MSDYLKFNSDDSELDAILAEVKNSKQNAEAVEDEPAKTWSMDDIDRLIAMENGEEYVPVPKKETVHSEDLEKFLGAKVYLDLWVKVKEKWRDSTFQLMNFGYNKKDYE